MEQKCLDELIKFTLGKNISRLKKQDENIYTPDYQKHRRILKTTYIA